MAKPQEFIGGAVAGLVATAPMTLVMELLHRQLPAHHQRSLPPRRITMGVLGRAGQRERVEQEEHRLGLTLIAHFAYGAAAGSLYAPLARGLRVPSVTSGIVFGLLVWLVSYTGMLPALGLFPPPHRESPLRNLLMIIAHVVWGSALAVLLQADPTSSIEQSPPTRSI